MAQDQFTAELEWLCRMRIEARRISTLLRKTRSWIELTASSESEGGLRVWVTPEAHQMHVDLERAIEVLGSETAKFLKGPVYSHTGYLPKGTAGAAPLVEVEKDEIPDTRPIKGPGRRHGYRH